MKIKCFLFILLSHIFLVSIIAQEQQNNEYVFDEFKNGKLVYKKGDAVQAKFNYDALGERMMFLSEQGNNTILELANPTDVSFVNIDGRVFEQMKGSVFYERINCDNLVLYIQWKFKTISKGKSSGYGTTSTTSSISNISVISEEGRTSNLEIAEKFSYQPFNLYYIKIKNSQKRFHSADSLAKLFKGYEGDIKNYIKENKLDIDNLEDIKKAVEYCSQYVKE